MDQGLVRAIARYRQASDDARVAEDGPFLVATGITRFAFERWCTTRNNKWQLHWSRPAQKVWLYGDCSPLHTMASSYFPMMTGHGLPAGALDRVTIQGSPTISIPDGLKEPDFTIRPREARLPTVVGEVAYLNESFPRLIEEKEMWCKTNFVQFFVGLTIAQVQNTKP